MPVIAGEASPELRGDLLDQLGSIVGVARIGRRDLVCDPPVRLQEGSELFPVIHGR